MSVQQTTTWTCDCCGVQVSLTGQGKPLGWMVLMVTPMDRSIAGMTRGGHLCEGCAGMLQRVFLDSADLWLSSAEGAKSVYKAGVSFILPA